MQNLLNKMERKDIIFVVGGIVIIFLAAFILDIVLGLVNGSYIVITGPIFLGIGLRNRLQSKL